MSHPEQRGASEQTGSHGQIWQAAQVSDGVQVGDGAQLSNDLQVGDGAQLSNGVLLVKDVEVGQRLPSRTIHIDRASLVAYTGASLDRNPLHWDERFARSVGLPDVIAHGMFTMGTVINVVSDWVGDVGRVVEYGARFTKPVVVPYESGANVEATGVVTALDPQTRRVTVELTVTCGTDKVLGRAVAVVVLN